MNARAIALTAVLVAVLSTSGCGLARNGAGMSPAPASSAALTTVTTTPTPTPSPSVSTVVVMPIPSPEQQTVTQTVQTQPTQQVQYDTGSLTSQYGNAVSADTSGYYHGDGLFFDSPSQNIGCYLASEGYVSCSIHRYEFDQPGPDCDRGIGATIDSYGSPALTDCSGYFSVRNRGSVLPYGESITSGSFACVSESSGVSCLDLDTDTGFVLSRANFVPID